jgi:hypothetical protein
VFDYLRTADVAQAVDAVTTRVEAAGGVRIGDETPDWRRESKSPTCVTARRASNWGGWIRTTDLLINSPEARSSTYDNVLYYRDELGVVSYCLAGSLRGVADELTTQLTPLFCP